MATKKKKNKKKTRNQKSLYYQVVFTTLVSIIIVTIIVGLGGVFYVNKLMEELPSLDKLEKYEPVLATKLYSQDSLLIKELYTQKRYVIDLKNIPKHLVNALTATEDRHFYDHWGFNTLSTLRAAVMLVPRKLIGLRARGASTITQQLARNIYVEISFERSVERKIKELLTSIQLESMYSKKEILEMYLTQCYFGSGAYGVQSAAIKYFNKGADSLKVEESALLIAQLKAPSYYNPYKNPKRALARRNQVLYNMHVTGFLQRKELDSLRTLDLGVVERGPQEQEFAPYFTEHIRQELSLRSGKYNVDYLKDGLSVYTTLDSRMQHLAEEAIAKNIDKIKNDVRRRFLRDENGFTAYVKNNFDSLEWSSKMKDTLLVDSLVKNVLQPEVALIAIDPKNGEVKAMVGGTDFTKTKFNRVLQAWRQPGSIFKPIVYLTALDNGYTPATRLLNQPVVITMPDGKRWTPTNYNKEDISGYKSLRWGLKLSKNIIAVRVISSLVSPEEVISYAKRLGIDTRHIKPVKAIALGAGSIRPIDIATAYAAIANEGTRIKPYFIKKIMTRNGDILEDNKPRKTVAISKETAFLIKSMMQSVVQEGTAQRLKRSEYAISSDVAGKTGTTNDFTDAWFSGFTNDLVVTVWVGLDNPNFKLGRGATGANTAIPIWGTFMKSVYRTLKLKPSKFTIPEGIVKKEVCAESGELAGIYCPEVYEEYFNKDHVPAGTCKKHNPKTNHRRNKNSNDTGRW